ncbi:PREDICTED: olfactory receptor-like protein OLF3-like [Elephantulus edwardii]|uniref:olfactory receptor-like protein OLF3-like n=1 Tax=Elephantulus edwardii TaxID=28737 RepID=UPI0003F064D5|nr:PREDICTED: olfactory receptor-like protein OLF3-like [Elephantulus edwardii]
MVQHVRMLIELGHSAGTSRLSLQRLMTGEDQNQTWISEFFLLGLSSDWATQVALFVLFLAMYLVTIVGNVLIILLIRLDSRLHTPMYFFLSVLSFVDLCYANSIVPQMLVHFLSAHKSIPFHRCVLQLYVSLAMGGSEFFLLGAMAYDRYVAVCHPLHYTVIMHGGLCLGLAAGCLAAGFSNSLMEAIITFRLPLCHNVINHFTCETLAVVRLSCVDISFNKVMVAISGFVVIMLPCFLVLFSYTRIVAAILRIRSTQGRRKAFGTCASHLTVVSMCFGATIFTYLGPRSASSEEEEKMVALFYAVVAPMLNPLIYSLRNKDVMAAFRKVLEKLRGSWELDMQMGLGFPLGLLTGTNHQALPL